MPKVYQSYHFRNARLSLSVLGTGLTSIRMTLYSVVGNATINYLINEFERERFLGVILRKMKEQLRYAMKDGRNVSIEELGL